MKQSFIVLLCILIMTSCFDNKPLKSAENISLDSISHYYSIQLDEKNSMVEIEFTSWPISDRDQRLTIPNVHKLEINEQILNLENSSYKIKIPIQNIKNDVITISYFISDTVFYSKRIQLARFTSCKVIFHSNDQDDIGVNFEPALNTFEELDVELKGENLLHKRFDYNESIRNGISFNKNLGLQYGVKNKRTATIILQKLYIEKYTAPVQIEINTSTSVERVIEDVPVIHR